MSLSTHFFKGDFCKSSINYCMGWSFFLLGSVFTISVILANPLKIKIEGYKELMEGIFIMVGCFLVTIISRCICYENIREEDEYLLDI